MNEYKIYDINSFNYKQIYNIKTVRRTKGNQGSKARGKILDIVCAFDIETTYIKEIDNSIMYIWQFQFGKDQTIIGRSWEEFTDFLLNLKRCMSGRKLIIYIHNASYEFSFIKGIYNFEPDEVFAIEARRVLKFSMFNSFEFRCSYLLSNMSLDKFLKEMRVEHEKQAGFDYKKLRYPWTPLSESEMLYCINDVRGLVEAIYKRLEKDHDNLYTIPLTSTGYVRRDCKKAMRTFPRDWLRDLQPDFDTYQLLTEAFRGGDTHANRIHAGKIIENVKGVDESSAYPFIMCTQLFPMSKYHTFPNCTIDDFKVLIKNKNNSLLFRIKFEYLEEKDPSKGQPYLSRSKCRNVYNAEFDNGRISSAEYLETTLTDIDFRIVHDIYNWRAMEIITMQVARAGFLPEQLRGTVIKYYKLKTELKSASGPETEEEKNEREYIYSRSKAKLNSLYGMCATNPIRQPIIFKNNDFYRSEDFNPREELEKANKKAFLSYAWGIVVTAWARYKLHEASYNIAGAKLVYKDTDSVKYIGEIDISALNEDRKRASILNGSFATDPAGVTHYMGVFEPDSDYKRFSTLGAKKYVYEDASGLHVTIAGVNKKLGGMELEKIENFQDGFTFYKAGGVEVKYNDNTDFYYNIDGQSVRITDNAVIKESTYTLGTTADYLRILQRGIQVKYFPYDIKNIYQSFK